MALSKKLEQAVRRSIAAPPTRHVCLSCQSRQSLSLYHSRHQQVRRVQSSTPRSASLFGFGKRKEEDPPVETTQETAPTETEATQIVDSEVPTTTALDPTSDPTYVQALSWEGVEWVGGRPKTAGQKLPAERAKVEYKGWASNQPISLNQLEAHNLVRQAAIDVLGKPKHNKPISSKQALAGLTEALRDEQSVEWTVLHAPVSVKFAVSNLIQLRSGHKLSDAFLSDPSTNLGTMLSTLQHLAISSEEKRKSPALANKPTALALLRMKQQQQQQGKSGGAALSLPPNVKVVSKRVGMIDREREVGRWKLIEKELQYRGLPVTGKDKAPRSSLP